MKQLEEVVQFFHHSALVSEKSEMSLLKDAYIDSRDVLSNSVFIALTGGAKHGNDFIKDAVSKGASLILTDKALTQEQTTEIQQTPCLFVADLKERLASFADWFYDAPSTKLKLVGITGTNGKTSSAFYTAQLLKQAGKKVALLGTLGNGLLDKLEPSLNTTMDIVSVSRLLNQFCKQGVDWCIMEISSHAIVLDRIKGLNFQTLAITQVTRDHLDFHGTIETYRAVKRALFEKFPTTNRVLNLEDADGVIIAQKLREDCQDYFGYSQQNTPKFKPDLRASSIRFLEAGSELTLSHGEQKTSVKLPILGQFNIENVLCALSICLVNDLFLEAILPKLMDLNAVPGRLESLVAKTAQTPTILIDYAHTPDALESVLKAIKGHLKNGNLKVVFGCGGDRDVGKRPLMGRVAGKLAHSVILTNDNPRTENPIKIIEEIKVGMLSLPNQPQVILDREQAIFDTLNKAEAEDIILIAGKGHEDYQEIMGVKQHFSDKEVVQAWQSGRVVNRDLKGGLL